MKTYKILLTCIICMASFGSMQAQKNLSEARIYINPGHGGWGSNDRPLATINYAELDTLGFFETNTNLLKGLSLRDELVKAGAYVQMSRTVNGIKGDNTAPPSNPEIPEGTVVDGISQIVTLSVICQDVETRNMDYFISIHSNATSDLTYNYPLLLYRGTDAANGNGLTQAKEMASGAWPYINKNDITYKSHYTTSSNVRGDCSFYTSGHSTNSLGYYGYLSVLKHGCNGFLSEGCFHTYQPERQRLLNKDYCRQEGVRYSRAIRAWFGDNSEAKGCIMGAVKDKNRSLTHTYYQSAKGNDIYYPLNNTTVILQNSGGTEIGRYTTDKEYNGVFVFTDLIPGQYKLVYDVEGYHPVTQTITVTANQTAFATQLLESDSVVQEEEANIFASGLKATEATPGSGAVEITYTLNANAASVTVNVENNSPISITNADKLLKGTHTVKINLKTVPAEGESLSWSLTVTGVNATPETYVKTTNSNDDQQLAFYFPRGVAVDNNTESPFFGNIYVSEGRGSEERTDWGTPRPVPDTRKTKTGLYALTPDLKHLFNSVTSWADSLTYNESPGRISVGEDGKVYIANNTASARTGVYILDPANPNAFVQALETPNAAGIASNHGRVAHCYALGTGADTKLYTADIATAGSGDPTSVFRYNIGDAALPYTSAVNETLYTYTGPKEARRINAMAPGKNGGWWLSQACNGTGSTSQPAVVFIKNVEAFNSGSSITSASGVMAVSPDGTLIAMPEYSTSDNAIGNANVRVYTVTYSGNIPSGLTHKFTVANGSNVNSLAFDHANNLYTVSNGDERLKVYALNKAVNTSTTDAPAAQKITRGEGDSSMAWFGDGSASTFYIGSAEELAALAQYMNEAIERDFIGKTIELTSDIDLSDYDSSNTFANGKGWMPIGWNGTVGYNHGFGGTFDGKGHTISNMYVNITVAAGSNGFGGLFGYLVETGKICNLKLVNINVETTGNRTGGLFGWSYGPAVVEKVYVEGKVKGGDSVGGVAGGFGSTGTECGAINNCHADVDVIGGTTVGGILGGIGNGGGSMANCYVTGTVTGAVNVGGLVGAGAISNTNNSISNSVALNTSVKATTGPAGRVSAINNGPRTNNAALKTMTTDGGIAFSGANTGDGIDGEDITMEEILGGDGTIGGRFTAANGWTVESGKLPVLFGTITGINVPESNPLKAWVSNDRLFVSGLTIGETLSVYTVSGSLIYQSIATSKEQDISLQTRGVYIVRVNGKAVKVIK